MFMFLKVNSSLDTKLRQNSWTQFNILFLKSDTHHLTLTDSYITKTTGSVVTLYEVSCRKQGSALGSLLNQTLNSKTIIIPAKL